MDVVAEVAEGDHRNPQLAERKFEPGLDCAERDAGMCRDLALAHAAIEGKMHGLLLRFRQLSN